MRVADGTTRDYAQEQIEGSGYIGTGIGIRQYLQCPRQQVVLYGEGSLRHYRG